MENTSNNKLASDGIAIRNLNHAYNEELVLKSIDCSFQDGMLVALLGPSGCGKTTLLRICAGLIRPVSGLVRINGEDPITVRKNGVIGFAFQNPVLLPWRTALENILLPLEILHGSITLEKRDFARKLLTLIGLEDKAKTKPRELSGGMQQRVGLARALVTNPSALFLDEPFGQLDIKTREKLNEKVRRIWQEYSLNMLFVTHSIPEAVFVADKVIILSKQPASIIDVISIDLGEERTHATKGDPKYERLIRHIDDIMEKECMQ
jgi:NitT/TauT family transport system ATP-binding protein